MYDFIRRADAINAMANILVSPMASDDEFNIGVRRCMSSVDAIPSAEVRPVKEGEWVRELWFRTCSECGATTTDKDDEGEEIPDNFCPNCGAKMGGTP